METATAETAPKKVAVRPPEPCGACLWRAYAIGAGKKRLDGIDPHDLLPYDRWFGTSAAAEYVGVTAGAFRRMAVKTGLNEKAWRLTPDGPTRYKRSDIDALLLIRSPVVDPRDRLLMEVAEAAEALGVTVHTVRRLIRDGVLHTERTPGRRAYRLWRGQVQAVADARRREV